MERFKTFTQLKEKGIVLKIFNYTGKNNKKNYFHLLIKQDNSLTMYITYDKTFKGGINDIENTMNTVINIVKKINKDFLEPQKLNTITIPYLKFKDSDFITNDATKIQYFNAVIDFETKNKIDYQNFAEYINNYKEIADIPFENKESTKLIIKYNRVTNYQDTPKIFEYIEKQVEEDKDKEDILKGIQEIFGKTRKKASEMYTDYSIQKYDKESSRQLLDDSGTKIQLKKKKLFFVNKKYNYNFELQGLKSFFILRNCYSYLQTIIILFFKNKKDKKNTLNFNISFGNNFGNIANNNNNNEEDEENNVEYEDDVGLKYKLKRLKSYEKKIFSYEPLEHQKAYPRSCQKSKPIIMENDPSKNKKISKKSYTYSIRYRSAEDRPYYYYICPEVWCPTCQIPILKSKVKNIKVLKTKEGKQEYGYCPNGKHYVLINNKPDYKYPGFMDPGKNPHNLCMPCCFMVNKKDKSLTKKCEGYIEDSDNKNSYKHILRSTFVNIPVGKFALLPEKIRKFLNLSPCDKKDISLNFNCYLRKGVSNNPETSFIDCVCELVSNILKKDVDQEYLRKLLIDKIDQKLFISLNNGLLKRMFKNINNFKNYIKNKNNLFYLFIWDFITRPNIILPTGFNLVVVKKTSVSCPIGQNLSILYKPDRPTAFLIRFDKIYQIICNVSYTNKFNIQYLEKPTEEINKLITNIKKKCSSYNEIDWNKASVKDYTSITITFEDVLEKIKGKYKIKNQLLDDYAKVSGVLLNNDLYIPIESTSLDINYPFKNISDIKLLSVNDVIKGLNNLKINILKFLTCKDKVIGILLYNNRVIPTKPEKISNLKKYSKDISKNIYFYPNIDFIPYQKYAERIKKINEYMYIDETFERYKYEISRFLQTSKGDKFKKELLKEIQNGSKDKIRKTLIKLNNILLSSKKEGLNKMKKIIESDELYKSKLIRIPCFTSSNKEDKHCVCKGSNCKLVNILDNYFTERLLIILLDYPSHRRSILDGSLIVFDKDSALRKRLENELLITGNKVEEEFKKIFKNTSIDEDIEYTENIDFINPSFEGINKREYLKKDVEKQRDYKVYLLQDLNILDTWKDLRNPSFRFISSNFLCNSIPFIFTKIANYLTIKTDYKNDIVQNFININTFKENYSSSIINMEKEDVIKLFNNYNITIKNKNKITDLSDLYNEYNELDTVESVDQLIKKIRIGDEVYSYSNFDLIVLTFIFNIKIILLDKNKCKIFGKDSTNNMYFILYKTNNESKCTRYYILFDFNIPYMNTPDKSKRLRSILQKC